MFNRFATWAAQAAKAYLSREWPDLALRLCEMAEASILGDKRGTERMERCVDLLRGYLPWYLRLLVQDKAVEAIVQAAFDAVEGKLDEIAAREADRATA